MQPAKPVARRKRYRVAPRERDHRAQGLESKRPHQRQGNFQPRPRKLELGPFPIGTKWGVNSPVETQPSDRAVRLHR